MSKTLLLADDSVVIQKLVGLSFANEDMEVVTTDNGDDAITRARQIVPDVILADVVMPGKSGYEVCAAIKQDPNLAHVPVLLLTGTFEAFDEVRATEVGATGHITKPFEAHALVQRVSQVLNAAVPKTIRIDDDIDADDADAELLEADENYDFFDADINTLEDGEDSASTLSHFNSADLTPSIGVAQELDTQAGGLARGASAPRNDARSAVRPETPAPLSPSAGDPLIGFEDDFGFNEPPIVSLRRTPRAIDLDSALHAGSAEPSATIVAGVDDTNATTSPNVALRRMSHDEFEALKVHSPRAAIDQNVATRSSPAHTLATSFTKRADSGLISRQADATIVANLDVDLAETPSGTSPPKATTLDLGPSNRSADELDFAFDVSEQALVRDLADPLGDSFASLMDISESQILGGSTEEEAPGDDSADLDPHREHHSAEFFAAGYDVSSSDLATALPTNQRPTPVSDQDVFGIGLDESDSDGGRAQPAEDDLELAAPMRTITTRERVADLSPMLEQRIQETLEKVAWEAFSDLSESIVKQVMDRVEKIAWEVIPQMAETLVTEEIRKMKGEKD